MKMKLNGKEKRWIMYDVGNSAFTLLVSTIIPIYFNYLAGNAGLSDVNYLAYWGYAASICTIIVAILGPVCGTIADTKGFKKPLFMASILIGTIGCSVLGLMVQWMAFLVVFAIAKIGFSSSLIFYDSMLIDVTEIEVEFDRSLMIKDGFNPITHSLTDHINPTHENAETIKKFYNNLTTDEVVQALKGMIKYNKLLIAPSHLKRYLIYALLGVTGNYKEMHGLLVNYKANRQCDDSTERLYKLYDNALDLAVRLIGEYKDSAGGSLPLNKIYRYTFGGKCTQNAEGNVDENIMWRSSLWFQSVLMP